MLRSGKWFVLLLFIPLLGVLMLIVSLFALVVLDKDQAPQETETTVNASEQAKKDVPKDLIPVYKAAQKRFPSVKWQYLAAIHKTETNFGRSTTPDQTKERQKQTSSVGARGPMQFTEETWQDFGIDGNGDGKADIWNLEDSLHSAANKLSQQGIEEDVDGALFKYNRSSRYVDKVKTTASAYMAEGNQVAKNATPNAEDGEGQKGSSQTAMAQPAGGFIWPTKSKKITSQFGLRLHPKKKVQKLHDGIDIDGITGQPIRAIQAGTVSRVANDPNGYGLFVVIDHGGLTSLYGHLSSQNVSPGQIVQAGEVIGGIGNTGSSTGSHLHLTVKSGKRPINPLSILKK